MDITVDEQDALKILFKIYGKEELGRMLGYKPSTIKFYSCRENEMSLKVKEKIRVLTNNCLNIKVKETM